MSRVAYVNGQYVPHAKAQVSIDDRGHVFSDGVSEVILVAGGRMIDEEGHMVRLERSLRELDMKSPMSSRALVHVMNQTIRRNRVSDGMVYLQINRGVAPRNHVYDNEALEPTVVCTAKAVNLPADADTVAGVKVTTEPDIRWGRVDIKTVSLLPNALAKTRAAREGAYEAWLVDDDGYVTECSASNAWIVDKDGRVVTRPLSSDILPGITRDRVIKLAREHGIEVVERPFTVAEAKSAREAFLTSTTSFVKPVVQIDDVTVGNGHPGMVTRTLLGAYLDFVRAVKASVA
jgi:D-alanine transaminase